jgi:hypothetical protein
LKKANEYILTNRHKKCQRIYKDASITAQARRAKQNINRPQKTKIMQQKTSSKTEATAPPNQPANRTPDNS